MPEIKTTLTTEEYAILQKTQELMRIAGGAAETPDAYAEFVLKSAIASYATQYPDDTPSAAELAIHKDAATRAEAALAAEKEKSEAATAQLAEYLKLKEESPAP